MKRRLSYIILAGLLAIPATVPAVDIYVATNATPGGSVSAEQQRHGCALQRLGLEPACQRPELPSAEQHPETFRVAVQRWRTELGCGRRVPRRLPSVGKIRKKDRYGWNPLEALLTCAQRTRHGFRYPGFSGSRTSASGFSSSPART